MDEAIFQKHVHCSILRDESVSTCFFPGFSFRTTTTCGALPGCRFTTVPLCQISALVFAGHVDVTGVTLAILEHQIMGLGRWSDSNSVGHEEPRRATSICFGLFNLTLPPIMEVDVRVPDVGVSQGTVCHDWGVMCHLGACSSPP